jgi:hypothetical protein
MPRDPSPEYEALEYVCEVGRVASDKDLLILRGLLAKLKDRETDAD